MVRLSPPVLKSSTPVDVQNGTLVEGKVTSAELIGPLTGKTITELVQLFNNRQLMLIYHLGTSKWRTMGTDNNCQCNKFVKLVKTEGSLLYHVLKGKY